VRPPRLLFVVNVSWFFISHRLALAVAARAAGFDVHVATQVHSEDDRRKICDAGVQLHELTLSRSSLAPWGNLALLCKLVALYRRLRPDLVHHVTMKPNVLGGWAARMTGVPAVVYAISGLGFAFTVHGRGARIRRALLKWFMRSALDHRNSRVVFQNPDDMRSMVEAGVVQAARTVMIRGSGVDLSSYPPAPEPPAPVRVLLASRLLREKGVAEYIQAARELNSRGVAAEFLLAGDVDDGNPGSFTRAQVEAWQAAGDIKWLGHVAPIAPLLASVHVVTLPSYREGLPKVLIEAAAAGRAVVATDVPGCREIVLDKLTGLLVPPHDPAALTLAIATLVEQPAARRRMGEAGRERVAAAFTIRHVIDQTLQAYRDLGVRVGT